MRKITNKLCLIILLVWVNLYVIYELINAVLTKTNIWIPIIMLSVEIITLVIYRYIGQFGEKLGSMEHNPSYGN